MRGLLRNKEVRRFLLSFFILSAAITTVGFVASAAAGILAATSSAAFCAMFLLFTGARYKKIATLSEGIDKILHGDDSIDFGSFAEGELSILQSEVQKMTVRLKEQADNLKKDKQYLSDSLADIAHQIRTPLTSINILASLLGKEETSPLKRRELVRELETLLSRIDWLVTALLKISKIDAGTAVFDMQETPVGKLIDKSLEPFAVPLELRGVKVEKSISGNISCDPLWTSEAIGNIIKNCIEHVDGKGVMRIEAEQNQLYTQIIISDNGCGFSEADLPHLFERFYKGENSAVSNFGIGLALCRMIIERQNGTIKAENNHPRGARFVIKFYRHPTF